MPEVNLLKDTESPDQPTPKPRSTGEPELTDPSSNGGGLGKLFKSFLNRPKPSPARPPETSRMGLGKKMTDQRILTESRKSRPAVIPLPEDDDSGLGVNLLADELLSKFKPRERLMALGGWALAAVVIVALAYGGLSFANRSITSQIEESRAELARVEADINQLDPELDRVTATTKKISAVRSLVERHIRWTKFFSTLESYTLPEVFYGTTFTGNIQGLFTLTASADSYERVAQQFLVYQAAVERGDFIRTFAISGANRIVEEGGEKISFTLTLTVLPTVFENSLAQTARTEPAQP